MAGNSFLWIGTYTEPLPHVAGRGEGIYTYRFDTRSGELTRLSITSGLCNPSYLALAPHRTVQYADKEVGVKAAPLVDAFAVDPATGRLKHLNSQPSHGGF
ncbi:MAG: beta-propeller fold lactonase family protein, partial [Caldilineaceae bacterium]|nr:beta-propeller fold lactonase family protein [Caldilineaceae bacterium]